MKIKADINTSIIQIYKHMHDSSNGAKKAIFCLYEHVLISEKIR